MTPRNAPATPPPRAGGEQPGGVSEVRPFDSGARGVPRCEPIFSPLLFPRSPGEGDKPSSFDALPFFQSFVGGGGMFAFGSWQQRTFLIFFYQKAERMSTCVIFPFDPFNTPTCAHLDYSQTMLLHWGQSGYGFLPTFE